MDRPLSVVRSYLEAVGDPASSIRPRLFLTPAEQANALFLKNRHERILGIGWGARHPTKSVPVGIWKHILSNLAEQAPLHVTIFALPNHENEIGDFIRSHLHDSAGISVETIIGKPLRPTMVGLASCDAFVTSDSGLMHVADALGVPTFGLFGPTHPALGFAPAGERSKAFHAGTWCSPCHRHGSAPCFRQTRFCFAELDTSEIAAVVAGALNDRIRAALSQ